MCKTCMRAWRARLTDLQDCGPRAYATAIFTLLAQRKSPVTDWILSPQEFDCIVDA